MRQFAFTRSGRAGAGPLTHDATVRVRNGLQNHIEIDFCASGGGRRRAAAAFRDFRGAGDDALPQGGGAGLRGGVIDPGTRATCFWGVGPQARTERASLIHADYCVEKMAKDVGTIPYEIMTGLGHRAERHYRGGG